MKIEKLNSAAVTSIIQTSCGASVIALTPTCQTLQRMSGLVFIVRHQDDNATYWSLRPTETLKAKEKTDPFISNSFVRESKTT